MKALVTIQGSAMDEVTAGMLVLPIKMGSRGIELLEMTAAASFIAKQLQVYRESGAGQATGQATDRVVRRARQVAPCNAEAAPAAARGGLRQRGWGLVGV
jgi:hypothetical protein